MSDNLLFLPSTDSVHETSVLLNMTRIYEGLHQIQFRPDSVCMIHRHCILSLIIVYGDNQQTHLSGKERILRFIDELIVCAEREEGLAIAELRLIVMKAEPKKFSFEEFELQQQFSESQNEERKM